MDTPWRISIKSGLRAHFKQADGPSLPGTEWIVTLEDGREKKQVMVRAYARDVAGLPPEEEMRAVMGFVRGRLEGGWLPREEELVYRKG